MMRTSMLLAAGLGLVANPMVRLVLGPKWFDAIPVIQILAIAGTFRVLTGNSRAFLFVIKRPHLATALTTAGAVLSIALLPYAVWAWGIIGAGWARAAAAGVLLLINYVIICRICEVPVRSVCATVWRPVMGCLVMAAAIDSLARYWPPGDTVSSLFVALSCAVVLGASSYAATTLALWRLAGAPAGAEQRLFGMIREYFDARRAGGLSGKA